MPIPVVNPHIDERNPDLAWIPDSILVVVDEGAGVEIRLPLLNPDIAHVQGGESAGARGGGRRGHAPHISRRRQTINDLIIPLVADGESPVPARNIAEPEVPVGVALGEHEVLAIGITQTDPALGPGQGITGTAGIEPLVRGAAQALDVDLSVNGVGARADRTGSARAGANIIVPRIDDRRVGKTDGYVISGRAVLLEVARFADADEGIVRVLAIQRVGLNPLFTARNPVCPGVGLDAEFLRHEVGNDRLARQGR